MVVEVFRWMAGFFTLQNTWETRKPGDWVRGKVIKRVVGLPGGYHSGAELEILIKPRGYLGFRFPKFSLTFHPYIIEKDHSPAGDVPEELYRMESEELLLGEDEYFVVSDHRSVALDSRVWGGCTPGTDSF